MKSQHIILAKNIHIGQNKNKILFILTSSKMHTEGDKPQKVKISRIQGVKQSNQMGLCPFTGLKQYILARPPARNEKEQFFVYSDNSPVCPPHVYRNLKLILHKAGLDSDNYKFHGLRVGRTQDMVKMGISVETIKNIGR